MTQSQSSKTGVGRFFEDFAVGQVLVHATPHTVSRGDVALYSALFGGRFAVQSADTFAQAIGYPRSPIDDLLTFHIVFGKTVADISINAVANLGYAACRFLNPVYPDDTLSATSEVIGLKQNSSGESGVVYVRSRGRNQHDAEVVGYVRWVMVRKRDKGAAAPPPSVPDLIDALPVEALGDACPILDPARYDFALAGAPHRWDDYAVGEKIDHIDGVTVEEAEHQIAARLFQNNARVHFNQFTEGQGRFGRRLVYGGHVISLARALSFNGLANAFHIAAINGGRTSRRCSPATPCSPGAKSSSARRCRRARMSAPCACARSRPKTVYALISRYVRAKAIIPPWFSTSTIGFSRPAERQASCDCHATPRFLSSTCNRRSTIPAGARATIPAPRR
jgi:2-methylfumaryl-CoA hydratase